MTLKKQDNILNFELDAPILGLDIGTKRIGLAFLAKGVQVILPLEAVERAQGRGERQILERCERDQIATIVFGMPLDLVGKKTKQCENIERFCRRLAKRNPKIRFWYIDEHLSSEEAKARLSSRQTKSKVGDIDSVAACMFIEEAISSSQAAKFWLP